MSGARYTIEEEAYILDFYHSKGAEHIAEKLGREVNAIRKKAMHLGVAKSRSWSDDEDAILAKNSRLPTRVLAWLIPNRSQSAIMNRKNQLELTESRPMTLKERKLLLDNYVKQGPSWCALELERPVGTIHGMATRLGLTNKGAKSRPKERYTFTSQELKDCVLVEFMTSVDIGERYGISPLRVRTAAGKMLSDRVKEMMIVRNVSMARSARSKVNPKFVGSPSWSGMPCGNISSKKESDLFISANDGMKVTLSAS